MTQLTDMTTSDLIELARFYLSSNLGTPIPDEIGNEVLNRLDCARVAARQAIKERDELKLKLDEVSACQSA